MRADDILESFPGFLSVMVIFQHYPGLGYLHILGTLSLVPAVLEP